MLELYYNFSAKFCDTDKYDEMEVDTKSLYLALEKKNCIKVHEVEKGKSGNCYAAKTVMIRKMQTLAAFSNPGRAVLNTKKKHDKREPGLYKEEFRCSESFCFCSKTTAVTTL